MPDALIIRFEIIYTGLRAVQHFQLPASRGMLLEYGVGNNLMLFPVQRSNDHFIYFHAIQILKNKYRLEKHLKIQIIF